MADYRGSEGWQPIEGVHFVKRPNGCWEWIRSLDSSGYGQIHIPGSGKNGRPLRASRAMFLKVFGALLPGELVRHTCDNRPCIRPSHLRRGTKKDNFEDFRKRGDYAGSRKKWSASMAARRARRAS